MAFPPNSINLCSRSHRHETHEKHIGSNRHSARSAAVRSHHSQNKSQPTVGDTTRTIVRILYWLCVAAALWFAYLNIAPYAAAVQFVLAGTLDQTLLQWLGSIPVLGNFINFFSLGIHWIIGLILWAAIQTIEIFPSS
jgi:hypothetical protein